MSWLQSGSVRRVVVFIVAAVIVSGSSFGQPQWRTVSYSLPREFKTIEYAGDQFIILTADKMISSSDGITWIEHDFGTPNGELVYGDYGIYIGGTDCTIYKVFDFDDIDSLFACHGDVAYHTMAVYGDGTYVTSGISGNVMRAGMALPWVLTSEDNGLMWVQRTIADTTVGCLLDAVYVNGLFVAVGAYDGVVMTSHDGSTWIRRSTETISCMAELWAISYGNGLFVATGHRGGGKTGSITSEDGITWTLGDTSSVIPNMSIAYGNGWFVTTGRQRGMGISTDGVEWSRVQEYDSLMFNSVAFGNGRFVAVGDMDSIMVSTSIEVPVNRKPVTSCASATVRFLSAGDFATIELPGTAAADILEVECYSVAGRRFVLPYRKSAGTSVDVTTAALPQGRFLMKVSHRNGVVERPFCVVR